MPHTIKFLEKIKVIETVYHGNVNSNEVASVFMENLKIAKKHQTGLFLVNCLEIEDKSSFTFENYEAGILLTELIKEVPNYPKNALILPRSEEAAKNIRFFETVVRNRGLAVRTFEKEEDALEWLLKS